MSTTDHLPGPDPEIAAPGHLRPFHRKWQPAKKPQAQPSPLAQTGTTAVTPRTDTKVNEAKGTMIVLQDMPTIEKVAQGLNSMGVTPRDMMAIFQTMKEVGALQAELIMR